MTSVELIEKRCPRCGTLDTGHYCSNCSHPLDQDRTNVYREMYHSFFLKFFHDEPVLRFLRTWWRILLNPGGMNLRETYSPGARYMSDLSFAKAIFFLALGTTILKLFVSPTEDEFERLIFNWVFQTYVLWIFCFSLLAFIWIGRSWKKFMRYEVEDQRQFDSMYIYEYGLLITVIYVLSFIFGSELEQATSAAFFTSEVIPGPMTEVEQLANEEIATFPRELKMVGKILLIIFTVRFFWFHLALGYRANLPKIKLLLITLLCIWLLMFYLLAAELLTMPIAMLPILYIFSPAYYLVRDIVAKIRPANITEGGRRD